MRGIVKKLPGIKSLFKKIKNLEAQRLVLQEELNQLKAQQSICLSHPAISYGCYDPSLTGLISRLRPHEGKWEVWVEKSSKHLEALEKWAQAGEVKLRHVMASQIDKLKKEVHRDVLIFTGRDALLQTSRWSELGCRIWCVDCFLPDDTILEELALFCKRSRGVLTEWHSPGYSSGLGDGFTCTAVILNGAYAPVKKNQSHTCIESIKARSGSRVPWLRSYVDDLQYHLASHPRLGSFIELTRDTGCEPLTLRAETVGESSAVVDLNHPPIEKKGFVAILSSGAVYTRNGYVLTQDHDLLTQVPLIHRGVPRAEDHPLLRKQNRPKEHFFDGTSAVLASHSQRNYYHTLMESLPRVVLLRDAGWEDERIDRYFLNSVEDEFVFQACEAVGIPAGKVIPLQDDMIFKGEKLLVPAMPGSQVMPFDVIQDRGYNECTGSPPPKWVVDFLRKHLLPLADPKPGPEKIFIGREPSGRRSLVNHEEVLTVLKEFDFKWVLPEKLTFSQQINLFQSARYVAGIHGAALTNIVFSDSGVRFLELFPQTYEKTNYRALSQPLGISYHYLICESVTNPGGSSRVDDNLKVDIQALRRSFKKLIS